MSESLKIASAYLELCEKFDMTNHPPEEVPSENVLREMRRLEQDHMRDLAFAVTGQTITLPGPGAHCGARV